MFAGCRQLSCCGPAPLDYMEAATFTAADQLSDRRARGASGSEYHIVNANRGEFG